MHLVPELNIYYYYIPSRKWLVNSFFTYWRMAKIKIYKTMKTKQNTYTIGSLIIMKLSVPCYGGRLYRKQTILCILVEAV